MAGADDLLKLLGGAAGTAGAGMAGAAGVGALGLAGMAIPGLPLAVGGIELISGLLKQHQAAKLKDQMNRPDPNLAKYMNEIDRQRKSFETGSAYSAEMRELKNQQAASNAGIVQAARGNTGSALQAIEQVGMGTGLGYGKIAAQGQQRQDLYTQMYGSMVQGLEQRKYEQSAADYHQADLDARNRKIQGLQTLLNTAGISGKAPSGGAPNSNQLQQLLHQLIQGAANKDGGAPVVDNAPTDYEGPQPAMNRPPQFDMNAINQLLLHAF